MSGLFCDAAMPDRNLPCSHFQAIRAIDGGTLVVLRGGTRMLKRFCLWLISPMGTGKVRPGLAALYLLAGLWMAVKISDYYVSGYGFTYLIGVGEETPLAIDWAEERDVVVYKHFRSPGYDAQYYAQLALDPMLSDPELVDSVDNLSYRARRILFAWSAYLGGFGQPNLILNVFALQNVVCWGVLGILLWRWFPPVDLDRAFRWFGIMLSIGACFSVFSALVDAPSLLLLALALKWIEQGHKWRATAILALGGLAKETNVLGAAALAPSDWKSGQGWGHAVLRGAVVAVPVIVWFAILRWRLPEQGQLAGARNFALPFVDWGYRWQELWGAATADKIDWKYLPAAMATHLSLTVQAAFLLGWWRWRDAGWRLTVPFAALTLVLGAAVWEGYPGASSRVLLPMLLGFNLLVPKGRRWVALLVLGNLTMWFGPTSIEPKLEELHSINIVNRSALIPAGELQELAVEFPRPWHRAESNGDDHWRWSEDDVDIVLNNPYAVPLQIEVRGQWSAHSGRMAYLKQGDQVLWQQQLGKPPADWRVVGVILPPGKSALRIESDTPPSETDPSDSRRLAVCLRRLSIRGIGLVEPSS